MTKKTKRQSFWIYIKVINYSHLQTKSERKKLDKMEKPLSDEDEDQLHYCRKDRSREICLTSKDDIWLNMIF